MENRIRDILTQMTLEEKISLCNGADFWHSKAFDKYGIPAITMSDGPHGLRVQKSDADMLGVIQSEPATCFPAAVSSGASWDRETLRMEGQSIAEEGLSYGVDVVLGPGVNIKRDPRCGRNFEYFSEDPFLAGEMGTAWVQGAQNTGIGTSLKHFAANNQEYKRFNSNSQVDERTLREIYLPAFETTVKKAQPATVMSAYPMLNEVHCSDNKKLLNDILREEWGFKGLVVTDWGGLCDRVKAMEAGCDLSMPGGSDYMEDRVAAAVREGKLPESAVDACAARVIRLALNSSGNDKKQSFDAEAHNAAAQKIAEDGAVLLKNEEGILPLKEEDIVLIGDMAQNMRYQGAGSSHINPTKLTGLKDAMPEVSFAACCDEKGNVTAEGLSDAVRLAQNAKIAVVCAGLPAEYESEGFDRDNLAMPAGHVRMIEAVAAANPNTVVVLFGGSVMDVPWIDQVKAVLFMGLPGQAGGQAAANILTGKVNPSGKLTETWPLNLSDAPSFGTFGKKYTHYSEGLYVGYRYYQKAGIKVRFPFGYGCSYTEFTYSDLKADRDIVTAQITNTGDKAGAEIVQLYVRMPQNGIYRPVRELKGFAKVFLEPGETKEVSFELNDRSFAVWADGWKVPSGTYGIELGASADDIRLSKEIEIEGEEVAVPAWQKGSWYENPVGKPKDSDFELLYGGKIMKEPEIRKGQFTMEMSTMEMKDHSAIMNIMFKATEKTIAKGFGGKADYSDPTFKMIVAAATDAPLRATVLSSGGQFPANVAEGLVETANGHMAEGIKNFTAKKPADKKTKTSLMHNIIFNSLMKNRVVYDPSNPRDYTAARQSEIDSVKMIRIPKKIRTVRSYLGSVPAVWISKEKNPLDRIVLYIHGGGFVTGSAEARKGFTAYIADKLGLNVVSIDYRLAPEHPFPAGPEDCFEAYKALLEKYRADRIVLLGESAGGNLVLSTLLQIKDAGLPMPAGTFAIAPAVQFDEELDSYRDNADTDCIVANLSGEVFDVYLCSRDEKVTKDPKAAPYYGDFTGCTPVALWASETEVLLDDSLIMFEKLKEQGVVTKLYLRDGMMHTWMIVPNFAESKKDLAILGNDMKAALEGRFAGADKPKKLN